MSKVSESGRAVDVIPTLAEMHARAAALPQWAHDRALEIVYPDCPPPGVLYNLSVGRKLFLVLCIGEALVEASQREVDDAQ